MVQDVCEPILENNMCEQCNWLKFKDILILLVGLSKQYFQKFHFGVANFMYLATYGGHSPMDIRQRKD